MKRTIRAAAKLNEIFAHGEIEWAREFESNPNPAMHKCECCDRSARFSIIVADTDGRLYIPNQGVRRQREQRTHFDNTRELWLCLGCMRDVEDSFRQTIELLKGDPVTNQEHIFRVIQVVAEELFDGHFTVMKFTTNWRVSFDQPESREEIEAMAAGNSLVQAFVKALPKALEKTEAAKV